jgi:exosortase
MSRRRKLVESHSGANGSYREKANKELPAIRKPVEVDFRWLGAALVLSLAAFLWAYWPTLVGIVRQWINEPDYSHGFLVIPLALFFLWYNRAQVSREQVSPSVVGAVLLLLTALLRIAAGVFYLGPLDAWTIPLWVAGTVWALFGWSILRWSLPSIVFLWFMIPIPFSAETWLSVPLQALATKLSTAALVMLGQPALAEGNTIWVGEHQLFIEEACSGLRIFVGIFALAFAFALFSRWSWWQKCLALAAALPIAIAANVTRIVATGLLYQLVSGEAAKHFSHDLAGVVMIPLAAVLFWLFLVYLDHLFPQVASMSAFEVGRSESLAERKHL